MMVSNPPSLSSFLHSAVGLINNENESDKTLYWVSQQWDDGGDDEEIDNIEWDAMLACAHDCAEAAWTPYQWSQGGGQNEMLLEEVLPQKLLLHPQDGDKPLWWLRCHVSALRILCANVLNNILAGLWRSCSFRSLWACKSPTRRLAKHPIGHLYMQFQPGIYLYRGQHHQRPPWHPTPHSWAHQKVG